MGEEATAAVEGDTARIVSKDLRNGKPRVRRKMIAQDDYDRIYAAAEKESEMVSGLRRSLSAT